MPSPPLPHLPQLPVSTELMPAGHAYRSDRMTVPDAAHSVPGLPLGMAVPGRMPTGYLQSTGGVESEVKLNGRDADIMTRMGQLAAMCHVMATDMNNFQGMMPSTRALIKSLRNLASDLQEEIEVRYGPQGQIQPPR